MLKPVYSEIQASVRWCGTVSDTFDCPVGVRLGEIESPISFCWYIAFVADYIRDNERHGVQLLRGNQQHLVWYLQTIMYYCLQRL